MLLVVGYWWNYKNLNNIKQKLDLDEIMKIRSDIWKEKFWGKEEEKRVFSDFKDGPPLFLLPGP